MFQFESRVIFKQISPLFSLITLCITAWSTLSTHKLSFFYTENKLRLSMDSRYKWVFKYSCIRLVWVKNLVKCVLNKHQVFRLTVLLSLPLPCGPDLLVMQMERIKKLVLTCHLVENFPFWHNKSKSLTMIDSERLKRLSKILLHNNSFLMYIQNKVVVIQYTDKSIQTQHD